MSWVKTRYCYCDKCRFHKVTESGWETCPEESNPNRSKGSWLWQKLNVDSSDYENQDKAYIKSQLKAQVIEDVRVD